MNKFFDLYNVKSNSDSLFLVPEKLPFGQALPEQLKLIEEVTDMVKNMRKLNKKGKPAKALVFFQKGILRNCVALPLLLEDLQELFPGEKIVIPTYNLNQDCLESFFSVIRAYGGTNTAPSPLEMKYRIRKYLATKNPDILLLLSSAPQNVAPDPESSTLTAEVFFGAINKL